MAPHQENISVDNMIDRCIISEKSVKNTLTLLSRVYGPNIYNAEDVEKRMAKVAKYREQLKRLIELPRIEQRTPIWYETRKGLITASDFAQALGEGKFGTQKELLVKKCGYEAEAAFNATCPPLKWGTMFEPVAGTIYTQRNGTELIEFGLLKHPTIQYFGASPDGVTENGIMVEIKCPFKRKINGEVPLQYYYQIQGQLDVCGLDECDFFECEFEEYDSFEDLEVWDEAEDSGVAGGSASPRFERGVILEYADLVYKYSPTIGPKVRDWKEQLQKWMENDEDLAKVKKTHIYALVKTNTVRVYKSVDFLEEKLDLLKEVWDKIKEYRADKDLYLNEVGAAQKKEGGKSGPSVQAKTFGGFKLNGYAF